MRLPVAACHARDRSARATEPPAIAFGRVEARAERVLIVATGPSVEAVAPPAFEAVARAGVHILAINGAARWLPLFHSWFTLDLGARVRPLLASRRRMIGARYYAAVPEDFGTPAARVRHHRLPPPPAVTWLRRLADAGTLGARFGLSEDPAAIHTGNSGWGGLGLAYHMRPRRIALLGLDAGGAAYAHEPGRPLGSLEHLPALFASALPQLSAAGIEIMNGSPASRVACFERVAPDAALRWIAV